MILRRWAVGKVLGVLLAAVLAAGCTLQAKVETPRTVQYEAFGDNPGDLRMRLHVPTGLAEGAPLVVALHHCFQRAENFADEAGWIDYADKLGFALLIPEQRPVNDVNYCFNWFNAWDQGQEGDEPRSIKAMIDTTIRQWHLDPRRVFITGHSAGGSMALVMIAAYPDMFAGAGVFSSMPVGAATLFLTAPLAMAGSGTDDPKALAADVTDGNPHHGPWPPVSVWQGQDDAVVAPSNGDRVRDQWRALSGLDQLPPRSESVGPFTRDYWTDRTGRRMVEFVRLTGVGHAVPIDSAAGCGHPPQAFGDLVADVGVCSTAELLAFWGLLPRG